MSSPFNTLIISDLHLGEDLSPSANEATSRHVDLVERQLVAFFQHYSRRREDGRSWRVVVNGDMVDFMSITILPNQPELARLVADRGHDDDEFGLRRTINATMVKVKMVAERHAELMAAIAKFVARKHRIEIVCGNHDVEFHWRDVQYEFKQAIVAAYHKLPESQRAGAATDEQIRDGIGFHPWFFHEPGVAWIEHGHQYDENCSFDYGLNPLHPARNEIVTNVDTAGTRYLTNYVREIDAHAQEDWSGLGYVRFAMSLGLRGTLRTAKAYHAFARSLLSVRKATIGARAARVRKPEHDARLTELSQEWSLDESLLRELDGLKRTPVVSNMSRLMSILMLDKVLILALTAIATLVFVLLYGVAWGSVAGFCAMFAGSLLAWLIGRGRDVDPATPLKLVPERILARVDARYCIFGHTHKPLRMTVEGGGVYLNTGTWLPSGKPGLLRAFTHVMIRHTPSGASAELMQWRDGASRPFTDGGRLPSTSAAMSVARADETTPSVSAEAR